MKTQWWVPCLFLFVLIMGMVAGGLGGYNIGWHEGYASQDEVVVVEVELDTEGLEEAGYIEPPFFYWEPKEWESKEPNWEETLADILGEIDTANITIHIESADAKVDLHIFWENQDPAYREWLKGIK